MREIPEVNNGNPQISVIITIHNAEKYIEECLNSVIHQTFSDIEILCIDGGSVDATPQILQSYAEKDRRIKIINDPVTSYGHKVNRGIEEAKGKYVAVLESDDMFELFMLEHLYKTAEECNVDFVNGDYTCFYTINGVRFSYVTKMYAEDQYDCIKHNRAHPEEMGIIPRFWTGLFRKDFLIREQIQMNESPGASFQDMSFRFLTSALANNSYHMNEPVYLYRIDNPGSSMHDGRKTTVIADEHDFLQAQLHKRDITDKQIWHNAYEWKYRDFFGNMCNLRGQYRQELFERYLLERKKDKDEIRKYYLEGYTDLAEILINLPPDKVMERIEKCACESEMAEKKLGSFLTFITCKERVIIFGCGVKGKYLINLLKGMSEKVLGFSDNNEELWGSMIEGIKVFAPSEIAEKHNNDCVVIANKNHAGEIEKQLKDMGVNDIIIF